MEYTAAKLHEVAPALQAAIKAAPQHLQDRGRMLLEATTHVTRLADLLAPLVGAQIMEQLPSAYLLPHIHSYMNEVYGRSRTPWLIRMMPAAAVGAQATDLLGHAARLFGGTIE